MQQDTGSFIFPDSTVTTLDQQYTTPEDAYNAFLGAFADSQEALSASLSAETHSAPLSIEDFTAADLNPQQYAMLSVNDDLRVIQNPFQGLDPIKLPTLPDLSGQFSTSFNPGFGMNVPNEDLTPQYPSFTETPEAYPTSGPSYPLFGDSNNAPKQFLPTFNPGYEGLAPQFPAFMATPPMNPTPGPSHHHIPLLQYDSTTTSPASNNLRTPPSFSGFYPPPPSHALPNGKDGGASWERIKEWQAQVALQQPVSSLPYPLRGFTTPFQDTIPESHSRYHQAPLEEWQAMMNVQQALGSQSTMGTYQPEFRTPASIEWNVPDNYAVPQGFPYPHLLPSEMSGVQRTKTNRSIYHNNRRLAHPGKQEMNKDQDAALRRLTLHDDPPSVQCQWRDCVEVISTSSKAIKCHLLKAHLDSTSDGSGADRCQWTGCTHTTDHNGKDRMTKLVSHVRDVHTPGEEASCPACGTKRTYARFRSLKADHVVKCLPAMRLVNEEVMRMSQELRARGGSSPFV